jgi:hypothetical protein
LCVQDELESLPFPNDETEFSLPDEIFESSRKTQLANTSESSGTSDEGIIFCKLSCEHLLFKPCDLLKS